MERWEEKAFASNASRTKKQLKDKWFVKKDDRHTPPCLRPGIDSLSQNSEIVERNIEINECVKVMAIKDIDVDVSGDSTTSDGEEENNSKIELNSCDVVIRKINSDIVEKYLKDSKLENTELDYDQVIKETHIEVPNSKVINPLSEDSTIEVAASMKSTKVSSAIDPDDLNKPFHGWSKELDARCGLPWVQQDYSGYNLLTPFQIKKEKPLDLKGSAFEKATGQVFPGSRCGVESDMNISTADLLDKTERCEDQVLNTPSCKPENYLVKRKPLKRTQPKASDKGQERTPQRKKLKSLGWKLRNRLLNVRKTCRKCLKKSANYDLNVMHEQLDHAYVCQICTDGLFSFVDANGLKRHQEQIHSDVSLETTKKKTLSSKTLESGHVTKNINEDVAILAVMPKILKKSYRCERVIKLEDIEHVSAKNEGRSDALTSSNGKQTVKEEKLVEELKPDKHLDFNMNESTGDNMDNLWNTNLFDVTPDTLATQSTRETPPYTELEASSTAINVKATFIGNSGVKLPNLMTGVIIRGRVKTRGGVVPRMQSQMAGGVRPGVEGQMAGGARPRMQGQMADGARPHMQGQMADGARPHMQGQMADGARPHMQGQMPGGPRPRMQGQMPVAPANLLPVPEPKIIKVETIDISDEESLPPVLDQLQSRGLSVTRNRTPTKLKSLELPPGISISPASVSRRSRKNPPK